MKTRRMPTTYTIDSFRMCIRTTHRQFIQFWMVYPPPLRLILYQWFPPSQITVAFPIFQCSDLGDCPQVKWNISLSTTKVFKPQTCLQISFHQVFIGICFKTDLGILQNSMDINSLIDINSSSSAQTVSGQLVVAFHYQRLSPPQWLITKYNYQLSRHSLSA